MLITRTTDYAIRILMALSNAPGKRMRTSELAAATSVPKMYASKVITLLVRKGWIGSTRGSGGGLVLTNRVHGLTVLDVAELFEGRLHLHVCTGADGCEFAPRCPVHGVWRKAETELRKFLGGYRIEDLAVTGLRKGLFDPTRVSQSLVSINTTGADPSEAGTTGMTCPR